MKRAIIFSEGGARYGFGHLSRCSAMAAALEVRGVDVKMAVNADHKAVKTIMGYGVKAVRLDWLRKKRAALKLAGAADAILVDSYFAPGSFYSSMRYIGNCSCLAALDDYGRIGYDADIVINPSVQTGAYLKKILYSSESGYLPPKYLLGRDYVILRGDFCGRVPGRKNAGIKNILIIFGGGSEAAFTMNAARRLAAEFPHVSFHVMTGGRTPAEFGRLQRAARNIKAYPALDAKEMRRLMLECDAAVTACGQTLYELAYCGVPSIGVMMADNQAFNVSGTGKAGFLKFAGRAADIDIFDRIIASVRSISDYSVRDKMSRAGRRLVDGLGAGRIADAVMERMPPEVRLRKARRSDCRDIWRWRNDPRVRKISFNSGRIDYAEHKKWFNKRIRDGKSIFFIGINERGDKIGQARFDFEGSSKSAGINVNLNPKFFGRGYGSVLIRRATESFMSAYRAGFVSAEILCDNAVSIKAFLKAGYVMRRRRMKDGRRIYEFRYTKGEI